MKDSPSADTTVSNATPRAEKRTNSVPLTAHLSLIGAATFWGLMSPLGKDAMTHGFDGIDMVSFRVAGGTESHLAHQCRNRHHVDADFRPHAFGPRVARTRDVAQGRRGGAGLHGGAALGVVECACRRRECRDGQFAR